MTHGILWPVVHYNRMAAQTPVNGYNIANDRAQFESSEASNASASKSPRRHSVHAEQVRVGPGVPPGLSIANDRAQFESSDASNASASKSPHRHSVHAEQVRVGPGVPPGLSIANDCARFEILDAPNTWASKCPPRQVFGTLSTNGERRVTLRGRQENRDAKINSDFPASHLPAMHSPDGKEDLEPLGQTRPSHVDSQHCRDHHRETTNYCDSARQILRHRRVYPASRSGSANRTYPD